MTETESFHRLLTAGDTDLTTLRQRLEREPRLANTFLGWTRPWGDEQWMPLHIAAEAGREDVVALLLEQGVSPDCRTRFVTPTQARQTPLHLAAARGDSGVVRRLLEASAEVEVRDAQQRSPLWLAARHGHAEAAWVLLRRGAQVDAPDQQGRTPLHAALLEAGGLPTAEVLIDASAQVNAVCPKEPEGYTPLHRCVTLGSAAVGVARKLLQAGADPSLADPRTHRTPAGLAAHLGQSAFETLWA